MDVSRLPVGYWIGHLTDGETDYWAVSRGYESPHIVKFSLGELSTALEEELAAQPAYTGKPVPGYTTFQEIVDEENKTKNLVKEEKAKWRLSK